MIESLLQKKQKRSPENFFTLQQIGRYIFANLQQYSTTQLGNFFAPKKKENKIFFSYSQYSNKPNCKSKYSNTHKDNKRGDHP